MGLGFRLKDVMHRITAKFYPSSLPDARKPYILRAVHQPELDIHAIASKAEIYNTSVTAKLVCRVPDLPEGSYTLRFVTRFSKTGQLLKMPRTLVYALLLTARPDDGNVHDPPAGGGQSLLRAEDGRSCGRRTGRLMSVNATGSRTLKS